MVHPDYQYDPKLLPRVIEPIERDEADVVLGSRLMEGNPMRQGMPWWKYVSNRFLTFLENRVFGLQLSEYHTGYRAYRRQALEAVNLETNSDNFLFDQEIVAQFVDSGMASARCRYRPDFPETSSHRFCRVRYTGCPFCGCSQDICCIERDCASGSSRVYTGATKR